MPACSLTFAFWPCCQKVAKPGQFVEILLRGPSHRKYFSIISIDSHVNTFPTGEKSSEHVRRKPHVFSESLWKALLKVHRKKHLVDPQRKMCSEKFTSTKKNYQGIIGKHFYLHLIVCWLLWEKISPLRFGILLILLRLFFSYEHVRTRSSLSLCSKYVFRTAKKILYNFLKASTVIFIYYLSFWFFYYWHVV